MSIDKPELSEFESVDPAPPSSEKNISRLRNTLVDEEEKNVSKNESIIRS